MNDTQSSPQPKDSDISNKKEKPVFKPITRSTTLVISGAVLFISAAVLLTVSRTVNYYVSVNWVFSWLFAAFIALSLIPIAIGFEQITYMYFADHISRDGNQMRLYLLIFAIGELLAPLVYFSVVFGSLALVLSLFTRALGFRKLDKSLIRIRNVTGIRTGSIFYQIYGFYPLITSILASIANAAEDESMLLYIFIFEGVVQALLMIIVGSKLLIDMIMLRRYVINKGIEPKRIKLYGTIKKGINY